jgi:predicted metal-dependent phosphoesterase TrpH
LIDLHIHTTASDGTWTPEQIVTGAKQSGLDAIAITDHDTFAGYEEARPIAAREGVPLICGIELSTKLQSGGTGRPRTVHLLGYFLRPPGPALLEWVKAQQQIRHERNVQLSARLAELGVPVTIDEVRERGRSMAGRPHFASLMVEKGYVASLQEAFDKYLDEKGAAYVDKHDPSLAEGIRQVREGGGISSLAHPIRLNRFGREEEDLIRQMAKMGLQAVEAWHSDHTPRHRERYEFLAARYRLAVTGGSDFHGDNKPGVSLGTGKGNNVSVPRKVLERLRSLARV